MTVRQFLARHDLLEFAHQFEAHHITVADLSDLTDEDLLNDLGISRFSDRKRIRSAIAAFVQALDGATAGALSGVTRIGLPDAGTIPVAALPGRLGSYRVLGVLGAGGMGTVVRARHVEEGWATRQGGDVAIKLIHAHIVADPTFRERFFAEADLGRRIQHPSLVPTWDVLSEGAWLGTVMSFVSGAPLTTRVQLGGIPVLEVIALLAPVAEALDYLHGQGIVHRDIKPANIIIRPDGQPVVLDLGIAKDTRAIESHTQVLTSMGTSAWMAPEQADAKRVDGAADRYALGLIAYAFTAAQN